MVLSSRSTLLVLAMLGAACLEPSSRLKGATAATAEDTEGSVTGDPTTATDDPTQPSSASDTAPTGETTGDTDCNTEGCPCVEDSCGPGLVCDDVCIPIVCGDGRVDGSEECDDQNAVDGDGCDNDCTYTEIVIDVSFQNTCALIEGGRVRCWGNNTFGNLGYGFDDPVGIDEHPYEVGDIQLPGPLAQLQSGDNHSCGLLTEGGVICWGANYLGQLGYAHTDAIGDDEFPNLLPPVQVGGEVEFVTTGGTHACALTNSGQVVCWGSGFQGTLGYGNTDNIGDDEHPSEAGFVDVGAAIVALSAGIGQTCVIQANGAIRCWGPSTYGQLGYGNTETIGDDEPPSSAMALRFSRDAVAVTAGWFHTCALFSNGDVRCWGRGDEGQLGQASTENFGDMERATETDPIILGGEGKVVTIAAGDNHTCALLDSGELRCWGDNFRGQLGLGIEGNIGDDEHPAVADAVDIGGDVIQFDAGGDHTCAVRSDYAVFCWGDNFSGQLGLGNGDRDEVIGDDELPIDVGPVQILGPRD
jgi:cysteine-rich repeat protein